jgi:hypothetical protein
MPQIVVHAITVAESGDVVEAVDDSEATDAIISAVVAANRAAIAKMTQAAPLTLLEARNVTRNQFADVVVGEAEVVAEAAVEAISEGQEISGLEIMKVMTIDEAMIVEMIRKTLALVVTDESGIDVITGVMTTDEMIATTVAMTIGIIVVMMIDAIIGVMTTGVWTTDEMMTTAVTWAIVVVTSSRIVVVVTMDEIIVAKREVRMTVEMMESVRSREEPHASAGLQGAQDQAVKEKESMAMRISSRHGNQPLPSSSRA